MRPSAEHSRNIPHLLKRKLSGTNEVRRLKAMDLSVLKTLMIMSGQSGK